MAVRGVPVTGKPVIPAGNGITGDYRYRPVLRLPIPVFRKRHAVLYVCSRVTIAISEMMKRILHYSNNDVQLLELGRRPNRTCLFTFSKFNKIASLSS
jgi:hypothetical protein